MVMLEAVLRFATGQPSMLWFEVIHFTISIFTFLSISLERSLLSPQLRHGHRRGGVGVGGGRCLRKGGACSIGSKKITAAAARRSCFQMTSEVTTPCLSVPFR
jgi:hypothetical protein